MMKEAAKMVGISEAELLKLYNNGSPNHKEARQRVADAIRTGERLRVEREKENQIRMLRWIGRRWGIDDRQFDQIYQSGLPTREKALQRIHAAIKVHQQQAIKAKSLLAGRFRNSLGEKLGARLAENERIAVQNLSKFILTTADSRFLRFTLALINKDPDVPEHDEDYTRLLYKLQSLADKDLRIRGQALDNILISLKELVKKRLAVAASLKGEDIVVADELDVTQLVIEGAQSVAHLKGQEKIDAIIAADPVILLVRSETKVTKELIDQLSNLKYIIRLGHGLDNVDVEYAKSRGIKVIGTKGSKGSVSPLAFRFIAAALQNLNKWTAKTDQAPNSFFLSIDSFLRAFRNKTQKDADEMAQRIFAPIAGETLEFLKGKTIGIVGAGDIGEEIARTAKSLGLHVLLNSRTLEANEESRTAIEQKGYAFGSKEQIYTQAHFVVLITGLTDNTEGLIDKEAVNQLLSNPNLIALINPDREGLVVESEIERLIADGRVQYFVDERPKSEILAKNAFHTPHIGASTPEAEVSVLANTNKVLERILRETASAKKPADSSSPKSARGARLAGISDKTGAPLALNELKGFFLGIAQAFPQAVNGARLSLNLDEEGNRPYIFTLSKNGNRLVAKSEEIGVELELSKNRVSPSATNHDLQKQIAVQDLRLMNDTVNRNVDADLENVEASTEQIVIEDIDLDAMDNPSFQFYLENLIAELLLAKASPYGKNVFFTVSGKDSLVQQALNHPDAQGLFLTEIPNELKDAARAKISAAQKGLKQGFVNLPMRLLEEGEVPAFRALIKVGIYSGRIDLANIPQGFHDAYATLVGERPDTQTLKDILEGRADIPTALRFALKAITKAPIEQTVKFFKLMKKMIDQAA